MVNKRSSVRRIIAENGVLDSKIQQFISISDYSSVYRSSEISLSPKILMKLIEELPAAKDSISERSLKESQKVELSPTA